MPAKIKDAFGNEHSVLTDDDLKSLNDDIGKRFDTLKTEQTDMITGLGTRLKKELTTSIGSAIGDTLKPTLEQFEQKLKTELQPPANPDQAKGGEGGDKGKKGDKTQEDPALISMRKQLDDLQKKLADSEKQAQSEAEARRTLNLRQELRKELGKLGITGEESLEAAELFLHDGKKRIAYTADESTDLVYKDPKKGDVPLTEGLAAWAKTPEAKLYLPPVNPGGSGDKPNKSPIVPQGGDKRTPAEVAGNALGSLLSQL